MSERGSERQQTTRNKEELKERASSELFWRLGLWTENVQRPAERRNEN